MGLRELHRRRFLGDSVAPTAPSNLQEANTTTTTSTMSWDPSSDDTGVTGYEVEINTNGNTSIFEVAATYIDLTGLSITADVRIRAKDAEGNFSAWSSPYTIYLQLTAPGILATAQNDTEIHIAMDGAWGADTHIVERATLADYSDAVVVYSGPNVDFFDSGLVPMTEYFYRTKVQDSNGNHPESEYSNGSASTQQPPFELFAKTTSNSSAWAFDRLRLYNPKHYTYVKAVLPDGSVQEQIFSSDLGFEHTFALDLSSNINNEEIEIHISGIPSGADFTQLYAYPTGYGATRGKNAQLSHFNYGKINPTNYLRLENQGLTDAGFPISSVTPIQAGVLVNLKNNQFSGYWLGLILKRIDENGKSSGSLDYSGNPGEGNISNTYRVNYDNLIAKGWIITGTPPPQ